MSEFASARAQFRIALAGLMFAASPAIAAPGDPIAGRYICVFKPGPISAGLEARQSVAEVGGSVTHVYSFAIKGFAAAMSDTAAARIVERNRLIAYCEQDRLAGIGLVGRPGGTTTPPAQIVGRNITRVGGPGDGTGRTAWVIDSGIDLDHPDLVTDPTRSRSFLARDSSPEDANGHGTHVAGIIAARNNLIGVVGVAADATVVSLRVLDKRGSGPDSGVIAAIDYLAQQVDAGFASPGDVANLSLVTSAMESMDAAVVGLASRGVRVTIAAGNSAANANNYSPARANGANVYTVAAIEDGDIWAYYSNYGQPPVDYAEPGSAIVSTVLNGGYGSKTGTSMSAPHLAGILLLGSAVNGGSVSNRGQTYPIGVR